MAPPRRPRGLWGWSVGVLAAVVGVNLVAPVVVGAAMKEPLRKLLMASQVDIAVESWPFAALWWGNVDHLTLLARDVQSGDLRLEQFSATFRQLRLDPRALYGNHALVVSSIGSGNARGTVSQEALAVALARQPGVRIDTVVLRPGKVHVKATVRVLGIDVAVDGDGRFVLSGGDTLDLILDQATLTGAGSITLGGQLTTRVPSVLRVPSLPLGLRITDIRVEDGRLVLDAATGPS